MNLSPFLNSGFYDALRGLFVELRIPLHEFTRLPGLPGDILQRQYRPGHPAHDLIGDIYMAGLVDENAFKGEGYAMDPDQIRAGGKDYDGILVFGVELKQRDGDRLPTRGHLAEITRAFNREFHYTPVVVVFRYGQHITLAAAERLKYQQTWREGEKAGKVSLIKDINLEKPHAGHERILMSLQIPPSVKSFKQLYEHWLHAFDVNILNKQFYQKLFNWYLWALKEVKFPQIRPKKDLIDDKVHQSESLIRLLTRLLFVWFMKEKGLIGAHLFNPEELKAILKGFAGRESDQTIFYKAILQNLFFATLNQPIDKRKVIGKGFNPNEYGDPLVYRFDELFIHPKQLPEYFKDIPFLNGGLFACLDQRKDNENLREIRLDGFSTKKVKQVHLPDKFFFGEYNKIDLSNEYDDARKRSVTVNGIIDILNEYKFTIEESTPIEQEIALDPELLGKVFENLLASYNPETQTTARKQTGSFYTPREIVNYMVDESMIEYLKQAADNKSEEFDAKLRDLFAYNENENPFAVAETRNLIESLNQCKILDPACGSGAFPMGILHKMVYLLQKLDPENLYWRELQEQKAVAATKKAYKIDNKEERDRRLKAISDVFENNASDYGRKLYLIENCIFGVDIQPIAVQISKLRFFISLIIDQKAEKSKKNYGIRSLPNLETKFVAANTLISLEKPVESTGNLFLSEANERMLNLKEQLKEIRHHYFTANVRKEKLACQKEDLALRNEIAKLLTLEGWKTNVAQQIVSFDPYDQNNFAGWFEPEWMFGISQGFDVVIGNPPYLRIQGVQEATPELVPYAKKNYASAEKGNWDLYVLFTEAGYKVLETNGILAFIQPHKFFQGDFGVGIRNYISIEQCIFHIVHFGAEQMFESATNYTCLFFLQKQKRQAFTYIKIDNPEAWLQDTSSVPANILPQPIIDQKWSFASEEKQRILEKLQTSNQKIGDITRKIFQGIPTGADKVFVLQFISQESPGELRCYSHALEKEIVIERDFVKPFLMGKDVKRYTLPSASNYVLFPYKTVANKSILYEALEIESLFPLVWSYLLEIKENLIKRENNRFEKTWWQYSRPQNLNEFETIKILTPDIANQGNFTIDHGSNYHTTTVYSFAFKEREIPERTEYWLGLFNSKLMWFFLQSTGNVLRGGYFRFKTDYLKPFPVKRIDFSNKREVLLYDMIISNVQQTLDYKQRVIDTTALENRIDELVFKLYDLTYEDVKVIDPDFWLSEEEYDGVKVE
jgi:adenine-specific DNA-methyltransferase